MKRKIKIVNVCTANGGRSPNAQTQGRAYVHELGLDDRLEITSAGSHAALCHEDMLNFPAAELMHYVGVGFNEGTFHSRSRDLAARFLEDVPGVIAAIEGGDEEVRRDVRHLFAYLNADEVAKRNTVLLELGLVPEGPFHQQFLARPGYDLVLPMKESNAQVCRELYAKSGINPVPPIVPICGYAGIDGAIDDPYAGSLDDYRACTGKIGEAVRRSVDRAIKEFGIE